MLSNEDPVDNAFSHAIVRRYSYTFEEIEAQINSVGGQSEDMVQHAENNFVNKEILVYLSMRVDSLNLMIDSRLSVYPGTIYLEKCCLRPLRREDAETLTKVYGDPENMKLFRTGTTLNKEEIRNEIAWVEGNMHSDKPDVVAWSIITGDGIIGDFRIYDLRKEAKVRCCIAPEWHNRGIASSLRGIVNSPSIRDLNLPYITTTTHPDNLTSKSVLQHIGFEKLGVVPRYGTLREVYVLQLDK
jgi:RimJ/RimL family protein N-acetyltransferase